MNTYNAAHNLVVAYAREYMPHCWCIDYRSTRYLGNSPQDLRQKIQKVLNRELLERDDMEISDGHVHQEIDLR
jgi:REP element-mobilizing transposase RayT